MNLRKLIVLSVSALAVLGASVAEARPGHRHHHGNRALLFAAPLIIGAALASRHYAPRPYYAPRTYYYPPAPVYYSPPPPPVYIEQPAPSYYLPVPPQSQAPHPQYQPQAEAQPQPQADNSWYYCAESQAYYPNVQSCAGGWQRTAPQR